MKKVLFIVTILFVAVFSTACINNFAVQDLNNKAKEYMNKGDYTQAIERLKSSIDLDPSVFETHYNLAVVYTMAEDYINAVEEYKKVIEMKPQMAEAYYSLATAQNNLAVGIEKGEIRTNPDNSLYKPNPEDVNLEEPVELSDAEKQTVTELYDAALENYQKYLVLKPDATDKADVEKFIQNLTDRQSATNGKTEQ